MAMHQPQIQTAGLEPSDDTKLRAGIETGQDAIQEDLTSSRTGPMGNLIRLNKAKYKVLDLVWRSFRYQHRLGNEQIQS